MTVSWKPVTLIKARGFPFYSVSYTANDAVRIRRDDKIILYDATSASITNLSQFADYSVDVTVLNYGNTTGMRTSESVGKTITVISKSMPYTLTFYGLYAHRNVPL